MNSSVKSLKYCHISSDKFGFSIKMKLICAFIVILGVNLIGALEDEKRVNPVIPSHQPKNNSSNAVSNPESSPNTHPSNTDSEPKSVSVEHSSKLEGLVKNNETGSKNTSPKDTSPSSLPPTTTVAPSTTVAPPGPGKWNVTDTKNVTCIIISGEITINLKNATTGEVIHQQVPSNAISSGDCVKEEIILTFGSNSMLKFSFGKDNTSFYVQEVKGSLNNKMDEFSNSSLKLFETPLNQSYLCEPDREASITTNVTLKVSQLQVQAFKKSNSKDFDEAINCESPHTPDIVPIIVGCALAILVILVLVAYLISRRRSQSRGYFSM